MCNHHPLIPLLCSLFSVLGSRFSVLGSLFSVLCSRFSVLCSLFIRVIRGSLPPPVPLPSSLFPLPSFLIPLPSFLIPLPSFLIPPHPSFASFVSFVVVFIRVNPCDPWFSSPRSNFKLHSPLSTLHSSLFTLHHSPFTIPHPSASFIRVIRVIRVIRGCIHPCYPCDPWFSSPRSHPPVRRDFRCESDLPRAPITEHAGDHRCARNPRGRRPPLAAVVRPENLMRLPSN